MEAPHLQRLHRKYYSQGLRLIGVTQMNPTAAEVKAFLKKHGVTYPIVLDPGEKVGARYRLEGHPTGILIDRKGVVRYVHTGFLQGDETEIEAAVRAVLSGKQVEKAKN